MKNNCFKKRTNHKRLFAIIIRITGCSPFFILCSNVGIHLFAPIHRANQNVITRLVVSMSSYVRFTIYSLDSYSFYCAPIFLRHKNIKAILWEAVRGVDNSKDITLPSSSLPKEKRNIFLFFQSKRFFVAVLHRSQ